MTTTNPSVPLETLIERWRDEQAKCRKMEHDFAMARNLDAAERSGARAETWGKAVAQLEAALSTLSQQTNDSVEYLRRLSAHWPPDYTGPIPDYVVHLRRAFLFGWDASRRESNLLSREEAAKAAFPPEATR